MTKNTIRTLSSLTALTVLLAATGCEHPEMALDDWADEDVAYRTPELETADPLAAAEGKVYCGEGEEIYENSSGKSQCKTINVKNSCEGQSELAPWTLDREGEQTFDEDDERYIDGNKRRMT